jgi:hypothetical protein
MVDFMNSVNMIWRYNFVVAGQIWIPDVIWYLTNTGFKLIIEFIEHWVLFTSNYAVYKYAPSFHNLIFCSCIVPCCLCCHRHIDRFWAVLLTWRLSTYSFIMDQLECTAPNSASTIVHVHHCRDRWLYAYMAISDALCYPAVDTSTLCLQCQDSVF